MSLVKLSLHKDWPGVQGNDCQAKDSKGWDELLG